MWSSSNISSRAERLLAIVIVWGLLLVAFIYLPGLEMFRTPKEGALRAQAILSAFLMCLAIAYDGGTRLRDLLRERGVVVVLTAAVLWTAITTATSGVRLLSIESLVTVMCCALLFVATWTVAPAIPPAALLLLALTVTVNGGLATLQEYGIWNPFRFTYTDDPHLKATALLGNPNDVGAYLAICAVVLLVAAQSMRGLQRWAAVIGGLLAVAGTFVSQTRTAVVALGATLIATALQRSWKAGLAILLVLGVGLFAATKVNIPALTRLTEAPEHLARGEWNVVFSQRLPAFAAAFAMFRDHPVVGVGPGAYRFFYLRYRIEINEIYPEWIMKGVTINFAEVHNDHLQLLAETGLPGYALFVAACAIVALRARRDTSRSGEQARVAARLAVPLVVVLCVLALALFPLQIAATRQLVVTLSALIVGWSRT